MPIADGPSADRLALLTPKERECMRLVFENLSSKQIARRLGISQTSVDTHVRRTRDKLGVRDRYAAAKLLIADELSLAQAAPAGPAEPMPAPAASGFRLPPLSRFNFAQRLGLVAACAIVAALLFGVLLTAMAAI